MVKGAHIQCVVWEPGSGKDVPAGACLIRQKSIPVFYKIYRVEKVVRIQSGRDLRPKSA